MLQTLTLVPFDPVARTYGAAAAQAAVDVQGRAGLPKPSGGPASPGAAPGRVPFEQTSEGQAEHDRQLLIQYHEAGGQLDQHHQDIAKQIVTAMLGHAASAREIAATMEMVAGTLVADKEIINQAMNKLKERITALE